MTLHVNKLCFEVSHKVLLNGIDFDAHSGEVLGIIGPNGAGKSTLLKNIAGIFRSKQGSIALDNVDLKKMEAGALAKEIAYLSQFSQTPPMSVMEILELGRRVYSGAFLTKEDKLKIKESIHHFELETLLMRTLDTLSGGERQKVLISSALLQEPKILLLDEPISHLDPKNQLEMLSFVRSVTKDKGLITLVVLHDIQHAIHYTNALLMLKKGEILHHIHTCAIDEKMLKALFEVEAKLHVSEGHTFVYYGHSHDAYPLHHEHL